MVPSRTVKGSRWLEEALSDSVYRQRALEHARSISNVTAAHQRARDRIETQLRQVGDPETLVGLWDLNLKASTALNYTNILIHQHPELKNTQVSIMRDRFRQEAGVLTARRALAISPHEMKHIMNRSNPEMFQMMVLLWISGSRTADFERRVVKWTMHENCVQIEWANMKSDRYGQRAVSKFIAVPPCLASDWENGPRLVTWKALHSHLRTHGSLCTPHSFRRGAATHLAELGYPMDHIGTLTGHTPTADPHLGVRRYISPTPNQPEAQKQLEMSTALWNAIC
jgi:hypothetical protein